MLVIGYLHDLMFCLFFLDLVMSCLALPCLALPCLVLSCLVYWPTLIESNGQGPILQTAHMWSNTGVVERGVESTTGDLSVCPLVWDLTSPGIDVRKKGPTAFSVSNWFSSYLSNRKQYTQVNEHRSSPAVFHRVQFLVQFYS